MSENSFQISQEVLTGCICTAILSHAKQAKIAPSDVLYSFSTTDLQVSYPFQKEPLRLEWQPVNKSFIYAIRVWVTDGRNNILDLNGTDIAISLIIEKV